MWRVNASVNMSMAAATSPSWVDVRILRCWCIWTVATGTMSKWKVAKQCFGKIMMVNDQLWLFPPTRGICLFHGHGDECMTHEGAGVEDGVKYVLRTDVVYELETWDGPPWFANAAVTQLSDKVLKQVFTSGHRQPQTFVEESEKIETRQSNETFQMTRVGKW